MTDQKAAVFPFDIAAHIVPGRFADRFSYSSYFVPVRITFKDDPATPVLSFPQRAWAEQVVSVLPEEVMSRWFAELGIERLVERNEIQIRPQAGRDTLPNGTGVAATPRDSTLTMVSELAVMTEMVALLIPPQFGAVPALLTDKVNQLKTQSQSFAATATDNSTGAPIRPAMERPQLGHTPVGISSAGTSDAEAMNLLLALFQSEVGYLFLDRTRIRPKGIAIGEHVYSLSLAPSEELTLEQKSYSKRTETMEEADERENSMDLELASTLTSELNESMDRTQSLTDKWGLNISHTGAFTSPTFFWGSFNANHTIAYSKDVTEADTETARRSTKDSQSTSSKIAAKYRSLHKVSFSIKTETGFESTSKRVVRNQNRYTPVDYHFFKILRVLELSQERYGAMLCWAPFVKSPSAQFFARLQAGVNGILADAERQIPVEPQPPKKNVSIAQNSKTIQSSDAEAAAWGVSGQMDATYTFFIAIPQGWEWDSNPNIGIRLSTVEISEPKDPGVPNCTATMNGRPWVEEGKLQCRVVVKCRNVYERGDVGKWSRIWVSISARFVQVATTDPVDAASYAAAYADYMTGHKSWADNAATIRAGGATAAAAWKASMLANSNPVNELVNRLITEHFTHDVRDEGAEIELWQRMFQWDAASYVLYPGWWSDEPLRDPLGDPNSFFNASWARLSLPIRPGMEAMALRWIFSKTTGVPLDPGLAGSIKDVVAGLETFREANYPTIITPSKTRGGCPDIEQASVCLGHWEELLPTDGTHIEVTQSASLSLDTFAQRDLEDTAALREVVLESHKQDVAIKRKTLGGLAGAATVEVKIHTDGSSAGSISPAT